MNWQLLVYANIFLRTGRISTIFHLPKVKWILWRSQFYSYEKSNVNKLDFKVIDFSTRYLFIVMKSQIRFCRISFLVIKTGIESNDILLNLLSCWSIRLVLLFFDGVSFGHIYLYCLLCGITLERLLIVSNVWVIPCIEFIIFRHSGACVRDLAFQVWNSVFHLLFLFLSYLNYFNILWLSWPWISADLSSMSCSRHRPVERQPEYPSICR